MPDFPIKLGGSRQANADVLNFLPMSVWPVAWNFWYHQIISFDSSFLTLPAATTYAIDMNAVVAQNSFPSNVDILAGTKFRLIEAFAGTGITDFDVEVGDAGDPNGLVTITDVFGETPAYFTTPAAAEYADHYAPAFAPEVLWTATGANVSALTAGSMELWIPFRPVKELD
jgi:hypothetical protein